MNLLKRLGFGLLGMAGLLFVAGMPVQNTVTSVPTLVALQNLATTASFGGAVRRQTYSAALPSPPMDFFPGEGTCASAGLVNDGASCVNDPRGNHWLGINTIGDVRQWGADMTGATDSTAALNAALATGASIYIPAGTLSLSNVNAMTASGQTITCAGRGSSGITAGGSQTILSQNSTSGNLLEMDGFQEAVKNCGFTPSVRVTGYQVAVDHACFSCSISDAWMTYIFNGIQEEAGNKFTITNLDIGSIYGTTGILYEGANGAHANNLFIQNFILNNAYPFGYGTIVAWATSTAYTQGEITRVNGAIYQEAAATCTSASSGTGPSGFPAGTSPLNIFSGTIADGTCTWQFVSNSLRGITQNSWAFSLTGQQIGIINNFQCLDVEDNNSPGTNSEPSYDVFYTLQCDHNYSAEIVLNAGFDFKLYGTYASSSLTLSGLQAGGSFLGDLQIHGGRFNDNWTSGVNFAVGSQLTLDGASLASNSQGGSGAQSNVNIAAGILDFTVTNNHLGKDLGAGNANAAHGAIVQAGSSDYYTVTGNICAGNTTSTCVQDGGTGTHKTVSGNE